MSVTSMQFGEEVKKEAENLAAQGIDPNQIANILFKKDVQGQNYGIGIILNGDGKAMPTSLTLLEYIRKEIEESKSGDYKNSNAILEEVKNSVLAWQRIPKEAWPQFQLVLTSDAGTGALATAVQVALLLEPGAHTLAFEELGWPAYKAIAKVNRLQIKEFPQNGVSDVKGSLPVYQAGPMNTTGLVRGADVVRGRAETAAKSNTWVILDRAYSGFEFARLLGALSYEDVMKKSFELQLQPFIEAKTPFLMAVSPTKAFVTFSVRPCGFLLAYVPNEGDHKKVQTALNTASRARGSSFEHISSRAFAKAIVKDLPRLEKEHEGAIKRLAEAEALWKKLAQGTNLQEQFGDHYAGLFRNPKAHPDAAVPLYHQHLYPVFSEGRCRLNATGLPHDEDVAKDHVRTFGEYCLKD